VGDVRVVYRKFDGSLHWHLTMRHLGADEHGVWLGSPANGFMQKGDEEPVPLLHANVGLIPHTGWWTAWFNGEPQRVEVYCDITTPAEWIGSDEVTMVDLDLDVARNRADGSVHLLDEDEFADHQRFYGYPAEVIEEAEKAARWLMGAVGDGSEPFAATYHHWLAMVQ
jgi:protein associated with RNAse G/E